MISDLHMGAGRDRSGAWNPREDFRWHDEFSGFLDSLERDGRGPTHLMITGDLFDLLQSDDGRCAQGAAAGCTEHEALARLHAVLDAQAATVDRLTRFARGASNRLTVMPGSHDAALLLPALAARFRRAFRDAPGRVELALDGWWRSEDGAIHVEHGHQLAHDAFRLEGWPRPFTARDGSASLERSPGERLIEAYYGTVEARFPIVDNVAEAGVGVKYGLNADSTSVAAAAAGKLVRFLLGKPTWPQFRTDLEESITTPPEWDLARIRSLGDRFLLESFPADDPIAEWVGRAAAGGASLESAGLTDAEIVAVCDHRAALRRARRRMERGLTQLTSAGPAVAECPRTTGTQGAAYQYYWRSRDLRVREHLRALAPPDPGRGPIRAFISGHTHVPDRGFTVDLASGPVRVVNAGSWQRTIVPAQLETLKSERGWSNRELLERLTPEDLPACYSFVLIEPYADAPAPGVRFWRRDEAGTWTIGSSCS